jgi:hypothetical protein
MEGARELEDLPAPCSSQGCPEAWATFAVTQQGTWQAQSSWGALCHEFVVQSEEQCLTLLERGWLWMAVLDCPRKRQTRTQGFS